MKMRITAALMCLLSLTVVSMAFAGGNHGDMGGMGDMKGMDKKGKTDPHMEMMMNAHLNKFIAQFDTNKDKKISMDEWHAGWGAILRLADTDVDGSMSKAEAKAYSSSIKKSMVDAMTSEFKKMDTNGDGFVSKDEFKGTAEMLAMGDTNKDGKLSLDEANAAHSKMFDMHAASHDPYAAFEKIDTDKNGEISSGELMGWVHALFMAWDKKPADNFLTADELKASHEMAKDKGKGKDKDKSHDHGGSPGGY